MRKEAGEESGHDLYSSIFNFYLDWVLYPREKNLLPSLIWFPHDSLWSSMPHFTYDTWFYSSKTGSVGSIWRSIIKRCIHIIILHVMCRIIYTLSLQDKKHVTLLHGDVCSENSKLTAENWYALNFLSSHYSFWRYDDTVLYEYRCTYFHLLNVPIKV